MMPNYDLESAAAAVAPFKWYQKRWGRAIIIAVVVMAALLVVSSWLMIDLMLKVARQSGSAQSGIEKVLSGEEVARARQLAEKTDRPYLGNLEAKLVVVEFGDFKCPFSGQEFSVIRGLINKYKDDILLIYRHFPIYKNSAQLAQAAWCAQEQDKFWPLHDRLFFSQDQELSDDALKQLAQQAGVDLKKFNACVASKKYEGRVTEDATDGQALGVRGTPTFFINGIKVEGVVTLEDCEKIIRKYEATINSQ